MCETHGNPIIIFCHIQFQVNIRRTLKCILAVFPNMMTKFQGAFQTSDWTSTNFCAVNFHVLWLWEIFNTIQINSILNSRIYTWKYSNGWYVNNVRVYCICNDYSVELYVSPTPHRRYWAFQCSLLLTMLILFQSVCDIVEHSKSRLGLQNYLCVPLHLNNANLIHFEHVS